MQILSSMFLESIYEKQTNNIFGFLLSSSVQGSETRKKEMIFRISTEWQNRGPRLCTSPVQWSSTEISVCCVIWIEHPGPADQCGHHCGLMPKKLHHFHPLLVWQIHVSKGIRCCPTFPIKTLLVFISCSHYIPSKTIYSQPNCAVSLLQIYEFFDNSTSVYDICAQLTVKNSPKWGKLK